MALITSQIYQESDLEGTLTSDLSATGLTFTAVFRDKKTGVARTPQSTTRMFTLNYSNENSETIWCDSHSTSSGVTTLVINAAGRAIPKYGTGAGGATGNTHYAGNSIGCVNVARPLNLLAGEAVGKSGDTLTGPLTGPVYADATARDAAITAPANGQSAYLTAEGKWTDYVGGAWQDRASGTNPNASTTVAGKVEIATLAEIDADTGTGGTGAKLTVDPATLVTSKYGTGLLTPAQKANVVTLITGPTTIGDALHNHAFTPTGYTQIEMFLADYTVLNYTANNRGATSSESSANGSAYALPYSIGGNITDFIWEAFVTYNMAAATDTVNFNWGIDQNVGNLTLAYNAHHATFMCCLIAVNGNDNKAYSKVFDGTNFTNTLLDTLARNTTYKFRIEKTSTSIKFYINDVLKATQTTNIPGNMAPGTFVIGTGKVETSATGNNHGTSIQFSKVTAKNI